MLSTNDCFYSMQTSGMGQPENVAQLLNELWRVGVCHGRILTVHLLIRPITRLWTKFHARRILAPNQLSDIKRNSQAPPR